MDRESNAQDAESIHVLYLADDLAAVELALGQLLHAGLQIEPAVVLQPCEFRERVSSQPFDVVLADYGLQDWDGLGALRWLRGSGHDTPFVLVSGTEGIELAFECIKEGAADCVLKHDLVRLPCVVLLAVCEQQLRREQQNYWRGEDNRERRLFFQNNSYPMWVFDRNTLAFLAVNEAAVREYGYSRHEFLQMTILDIRPTEDVVPVLRSTWKSHTHKPPQSTEVWRHRLKDGRIRQVEMTACDLRFAGRDARLILAKDMAGNKKASERSTPAPMLKAFGFGK